MTHRLLVDLCLVQAETRKALQADVRALGAEVQALKAELHAIKTTAAAAPAPGLSRKTDFISSSQLTKVNTSRVCVSRAQLAETMLLQGSYRHSSAAKDLHVVALVASFAVRLVIGRSAT